MAGFSTEKWPDSSWYRDHNRDLLLKTPTNTPWPPTRPSSQRKSKCKSHHPTPFFSVCLWHNSLSLWSYNNHFFCPPSLLSPCCTPFSSLPLYYWWPWLQPPPITPSSLNNSKTVTLPCLHHATCMKEPFSAELWMRVRFTNSILIRTWKVVMVNIKKVISKYIFLLHLTFLKHLWNLYNFSKRLYLHMKHPRL